MIQRETALLGLNIARNLQEITENMLCNQENLNLQQDTTDICVGSTLSTSQTSATFNGVYTVRGGYKATIESSKEGVSEGYVTIEGKEFKAIWNEKGNCLGNPEWDLMRRDKPRTT